MSDTPPVEFPAELYARYLFYAQADLAMARRALDSPPILHEACFLSREAAEKALKAFLEAAGRNAPPLHGLTTLLRECIAIDRDFGRFRGHCQRLASYQDVARYPPVLGDYDFTHRESDEAVAFAQELLDAVRSRIDQRRTLGML